MAFKHEHMMKGCAAAACSPNTPAHLKPHLARRAKESPTMPFKSKAQQGFMNANRKKMEAQGVNVAEWNRASKGKKLPKRAPKKMMKSTPMHDAFMGR